MPDGPPPTLDPTLDPTQSARLGRQLDAWRRQLVALDRRQRQLYFKHTRTASLELAEPGPDDLAVMLAARPTLLYTLDPEPAPPGSMTADAPLAVDGPVATPSEPTGSDAKETAVARYGRRVDNGIRVA